MAGRKRNRKKEDPVASLVGLLAITAFLGVLYLSSSFSAAFIALVIIMGLYAVIAILRNQQAAKRLKQSGIDDIDKMDGRQFEKYLGHLFRMHGYTAEVTQSSGDYGADLVISKEGLKIVVQAKRYKNNVGLKAVQEIYAAKNHYKASEAWVITNSDYTEQAQTLARSNGVKLINRNQLIEMILSVNTPNNVTAGKSKTI